ncbi:hypothetical protein D3C71_1468850 [compost metagenome]
MAAASRQQMVDHFTFNQIPQKDSVLTPVGQFHQTNERIEQSGVALADKCRFMRLGPLGLVIDSGLHNYRSNLLCGQIDAKTNVGEL